MEYLKEILTIITAFIALATAWVGYKSIRKKQTGNISTDKTLRHYYNPAINVNKWRIETIKKALVIMFGSVYLIVAIWENSISLAVMGCIITFIFAIFVKKSRDLKSSKHKKLARYTFEAPKRSVMQRAHTALERINCKIASYNEESGIIEAKTSPNFWSNGEIIKVKLIETEQGYTRLFIQSDTVMPYEGHFDLGINARNIDKFYKEIILLK